MPGLPSNPYYSCSSQSVSVLPLRVSVRSELRIPVVYRDPPRFPACSICKPPRNESVNPVTSFAAILALRRRRRWYSHFPPNPPACLRLQCKSVETPIHRRRIVPAVRSGLMQIRSWLRLSLAFLLSACYICLSFMPSPFPVSMDFTHEFLDPRPLRTSSRLSRSLCDEGRVGNRKRFFFFFRKSRTPYSLLESRL